RGQRPGSDQAGRANEVGGSAGRRARHARARPQRHLGRVRLPALRKCGGMTARNVTGVKQLGMHARAAAKFVHLAAKFQSQVRVARDAREMDGKSIMGLLLLAAARGTTIRISAEGGDEADAVAALAELVESGFGEDTCSV